MIGHSALHRIHEELLGRMSGGENEATIVCELLKAILAEAFLR
jgi:hypothetical protein